MLSPPLRGFQSKIQQGQLKWPEKKKRQWKRPVLDSRPSYLIVSDVTGIGPMRVSCSTTWCWQKDTRSAGTMQRSVSGWTAGWWCRKLNCLGIDFSYFLKWWINFKRIIISVFDRYSNISFCVQFLKLLNPKWFWNAWYLSTINA